MVEEQKKRVEDLMAQMIDNIDKAYLRKIQGDMHRCAAVCCDNERLSAQKVYNCIENCSAPLNKANQYVQGEFDRAQNRLQRCVMDCNDKIKDRIGPNFTQAEVNKFSEEFESCATKCVDTYCSLLPSLMETIKKVLTINKSNS